MCSACEKPVGKQCMRSGLKRVILNPMHFCTHLPVHVHGFSTTMYAQFYTVKTAISPLFEQWLYPSSTGLITIIIIK